METTRPKFTLLLVPNELASQASTLQLPQFILQILQRLQNVKILSPFDSGRIASIVKQELAKIALGILGHIFIDLKVVDVIDSELFTQVLY
jgi:hypothetical protein